MTIRVIEIPFVQLGADRPESQTNAAIDALNSAIARDGLEVLSVETVTVPRFLWLGTKVVGIRAWCRTQ
ncbi:hypothetical protein L0Y81_29910 (plasmid) [Burkholderia multivorans]|uniref:Uncharacterized protein n=1 Tax=Burkholderia multivorans TaxID=87883 RepID=A0A2S9M5W2_9BURK|nr:hypothetical protein [Burkholderia multivorans]ELK7722813.1 hypothetical protein [Burkholderia cenocepacia]MBR8048880.1 hypothetical protein [Burkholderia multivorans]MBR8453182.1 hypothetical protein [Burkholderia multivorans]MBU9452127.1 hypothetical protein [Burkholderia multivorans]MBU9527210.1 hypothetical protein [Burkholderia multivorans]